VSEATPLDQLQSYLDAHPNEAADCVAALWAAEAALERLNELVERLGWEPTP
jgi:hypothetical protein